MNHSFSDDMAGPDGDVSFRKRGVARRNPMNHLSTKIPRIGTVAVLLGMIAGLLTHASAAQNTPTVLNVPGLPHAFRLGERVLSGGTPEGDAGFAGLQALGVKTIISVDGARPDVEAARRHGLRYVHLPHGYDGINTNVQVQLAKAAVTLPGPIYVHCHHGRHRGPAASAIVCMTVEGWSAMDGESWLRTAGTDTNYHGLFDVVRSFQRPGEEALRRMVVDLPEQAVVTDMVNSMVLIDHTWNQLKWIKSASYQTPRDRPDLRPVAEARLLMEHFREGQRLHDASSRGREFMEFMVRSESLGRKLENQLALHAREPSPAVRSELDRTMDALAQTCTDCHKRFRNKASSGAPR